MLTINKLEDRLPKFIWGVFLNKRYKKYTPGLAIAWAFLFLQMQSSTAQGSGLPLGCRSYEALDRLEIKTGIAPLYHSSLKQLSRGDAVRYALTLDTTQLALSEKDRNDLTNIFCDNNEWLATGVVPQTLGERKQGVFEKIQGDTTYRFIPHSQVRASQSSAYFFKTKKPLLGIFYRAPANFYELNQPDFHIRVNPLIHFSLGKSGEEKNLFFLNQRGVELRGGIDDRVFFYSQITDTQVRFPDYVNERIDSTKAIPGNGFYKPYNSTVFDSKKSYDILNGQGHIGFNLTRHLGAQFGHGRNFIGNGYRSLLLSDFSHNYLYLKLNWRVWRLHYQNIFAELQATSAQANPGDELIPKKFMAAHYLSFKFSERLSLGLFEATIFNRDANNGQFEFQYLNPVILYRTVEHLLDSKDNVLIGLDLKWNFRPGMRFYAQLILDEYKFGELTSNKKWWGNKYGIQAGLQYVDAFGIHHLDLRGEFNFVRPYTYTHNEIQYPASYSHYNQPLAHPLGANFKEALFQFRYAPFKRWSLEGRMIRAAFGEDEGGKNWGGNILTSYETHVQEYDNLVGQGAAADTWLAGIDLSFELWHNLFLDLRYFQRKKTSELPERNNLVRFVGGSMRLNVGQARMDF